MNAPLSEAAAHAKVSVKENRVYVGNLPYNCTYQDLKNALKEAGEVVFAEIFVTPAGQSKGCGIVEYADRESAAAAIHDLAQKPILGRPCFIREDREAEARFGATPIPGKIGVAMGEAPPFRGAPFAGRGGFGGGFGGPAHNPTEYKQLFIGNLPLTATWQDMKDLFREAGNVVRADVSLYPNGAPKGTGIVVYETHADAKNAVGA
ncbi:hypothetical protein QFC21_003693 [Naganishia friedmannii]|uniref:Uncharacterized protein n=1 Tax=Naganishia friedmannii TaxID=89922 RepID=A0ACC2VNA6_9TREE|nr:hypothetical protein QFC21_003693 [Naganishia friedmannii]